MKKIALLLVLACMALALQAQPSVEQRVKQSLYAISLALQENPLTAKQKGQLDWAYTQHFEKRDAILADTSLSQEEKNKALGKQGGENLAAIRAILTPEQNQEWTDYLEAKKTQQ